MKVKRISEIILAILAWAAVSIEFHFTTASAVSFFSYFTILSNLLIALIMTVLSLIPKSKAGLFVSRPSVLSALAVYIVIVALVYNFVLRSSWSQPIPLFISNNLLHVGIPLFFVIYWLISVPSKSLKWMDALTWLVFPLVYMIYSFARGAITHWYPYLFMNADRFGYSKVLMNCGMVALVFFGIGISLVKVNRWIKYKRCDE
jgi:hypothetical protein